MPGRPPDEAIRSKAFTHKKHAIFQKKKTKKTFKKLLFKFHGDAHQEWPPLCEDHLCRVWMEEGALGHVEVAQVPEVPQCSEGRVGEEVAALHGEGRQAGAAAGQRQEPRVEPSEQPVPSGMAVPRPPTLTHEFQTLKYCDLVWLVGHRVVLNEGKKKKLPVQFKFSPKSKGKMAEKMVGQG